MKKKENHLIVQLHGISFSPPLIMHLIFHSFFPLGIATKLPTSASGHCYGQMLWNAFFLEKNLYHDDGDTMRREGAMLFKFLHFFIWNHTSLRMKYYCNGNKYETKKKQIIQLYVIYFVIALWQLENR